MTFSEAVQTAAQTGIGTAGIRPTRIGIPIGKKQSAEPCAEASAGPASSDEPVVIPILHVTFCIDKLSCFQYTLSDNLKDFQRPPGTVRNCGSGFSARF